jgi:hypothetical protein
VIEAATAAAAVVVGTVVDTVAVLLVAMVMDTLSVRGIVGVKTSAVLPADNSCPSSLSPPAAVAESSELSLEVAGPPSPPSVAAAASTTYHSDEDSSPHLLPEEVPLRWWSRKARPVSKKKPQPRHGTRLAM